jgi:hypothetical protein
MSFAIYDFDETLKGTAIDRADISRVIAAYGVTEAACCDDCGGEWSGGFLLEMKSGKYVFVHGWCDYTGWGCQDGTGREDFDTVPELKQLHDKLEDWETSLPDLQKFIETGEGSW